MGFIENFVEATEHVPSPRRFRQWGAIAAIASLVGRKVFARFIADDVTWGNQFIMLVADAAGGKSATIKKVKKLLLPYDNHVKYSHDVDTPQDMLQSMAFVFGKGTDPAWSYTLMSSEVAGLFPDPKDHWGQQWYQTLAQLWDCEDETSKGTKTQGEDVILQPFINMLVGAQPFWFAKGFPPGLNNLGLPSRILYVYSRDVMEIDFYAKANEKAWEQCKLQVRQIAAAKGEIVVDEKVIAELQELRHTMPSVNLDNMSYAYQHRRLHHLTKLCMMVALSDHPKKLEITLDDLHKALDLLYDIEQDMHSAVGFVGATDNYPREMALVDFVRSTYARTGQGVTEAMLRSRMLKSFAPNMRQATIDSLVAAGLLRRRKAGGALFYIPGSVNE